MHVFISHLLQQKKANRHNYWCSYGGPYSGWDRTWGFAQNRFSSSNSFAAQRRPGEHDLHTYILHADGFLWSRKIINLLPSLKVGYVTPLCFEISFFKWFLVFLYRLLLIFLSVFDLPFLKHRTNLF